MSRRYSLSRRRTRKNSEFAELLNQTVCKINESQPEILWNKVLYISYDIYDDFIKQFSIPASEHISKITNFNSRQIYKDYGIKSMVYFGDTPIIKREETSKSTDIQKNNDSTS